jgi:polysaccharide biosynthesis transport protein
MTGGGALTVLRRRWTWIVSAVLLGAVVGCLHTAFTAPTYRATAEVFFSLQYGNSASDLVQGSNYAQNQVTSFARLATTPAVLEPVIDDLGLQVTPRGLAERVEASAPLDTVLVEISVAAPTAADSVELADAVAESLSVVVEELAPVDAEGRAAVDATTVARAELPTGPVRPDPVLDLVLGLAGGLALGLCVAWAREMSDVRVHDAEDLGSVTDLPLLGSIGVLASGAERRAVVAAEPHSSQAESFRQLRTNLQFVEIGGDRRHARAQVVATTSSVAGEGKSTVATNLALALAETGARVLLVDADLRRPTVADVLGLEAGAGLTTVLLGQATTEEVLQEWGTAGLQVLTSGPLPPNPSELLGSAAMQALVDRWRDDYDHVVLDVPPLLPVADAAILARVADGTAVVVGAGTVRRPQLSAALQSLANVGARVLGVVLNKVPRSEDVYGYATSDDPTGVQDAGPALDRSTDPGVYQGRPPVGPRRTGDEAVAVPPHR